MTLESFLPCRFILIFPIIGVENWPDSEIPDDQLIRLCCFFPQAIHQGYLLDLEPFKNLPHIRVIINTEDELAVDGG